MIAYGADGKPDFELVMSRFQFSRLKNLQSVHFAAFDVLVINGKSVMHLPLERRLELTCYQLCNRMMMVRLFTNQSKPRVLKELSPNEETVGMSWIIDRGTDLSLRIISLMKLGYPASERMNLVGRCSSRMEVMPAYVNSFRQKRVLSSVRSLSSLFSQKIKLDVPGATHSLSRKISMLDPLRSLAITS
jgi:hypothetical protein